MVFGADVLRVLWTLWGVLTGVLVLLLIYRSTLEMHEDDQLFLDQVEEKMGREQRELVQKMRRLNPYLKALGIASGVLVLVIAGIWVWRGLKGAP
jgi:membrane-associated PAP2 superfamily phosphatase